RLRAASLRSAAKTAKRAELSHLVVLLSLVGVAQHLIRLRDLLEALGGFRIAGVFVGMVFRGELAVLLLDLILRRGRRNTEDRVIVLRLGHISQYVLSRSTASRRRARDEGVVR